MPDTAIIASAEALLECFIQELNKNPNPPELVCFRVGSDPVAAEFDETGKDYCCSGLAYLRVLRRFPAGEQFPIQDEQVMDCQPLAWGVNFELGAFRCAPDGVDCEGWKETFINVQNDQQAMNTAICCWIEDQKVNNLFFMNSMIRDWRPFALQGGCTGGGQDVQAQYQAGG